MPRTDPNSIPRNWPRLLIPRPTSITPINAPPLPWPANPTLSAGARDTVLSTALDQLSARPANDTRTATITLTITNPQTTSLTLPTHDQRYRLTINPATTSPIQINAPTPIAARYALTTLAQLRTICGAHLPACTITDQPVIPGRGLMLDVSRDRVPTMDFARQLITTLADLKINHLQFYFEHTFACAGHEPIWQNASPFTPDEIRTLDAFAASHGIELVANQNCFGHLTRFLSHPDYAHLAETHGNWIFDNGAVRVPRTGPFSLCPTDPKSLAFVTNLLEQLIPCFTSNRINLGCDETFDVGTGRSERAVAELGRTRVALDFVNSIVDAARRIRPDVQPMIWADLLLTDDRKAAKQFPDDVAALLWGYESDTPFEKHAQRIAADSDNARPIWLCPGTSAWRSITGRSSTRNANIAAAVNTAIRYSAPGILMTEWGDHGHRQQWPVALHAVAHAAACCWNPVHTTDPAHRATALHFMHDPTTNIGPFLESLGDLDKPLREAHDLYNTSALYTEMHESLTIKPHLGSLDDWQSLHDRLESLARSQPQSNSKLVNDELTHTLDVTRFAVNRAISRRDPQSMTTSQPVDSIVAIIADHRRLWLARSRPGGLEDSTRYYESLRDELIART